MSIVELIYFATGKFGLNFFKRIGKEKQSFNEKSMKGKSQSSHQQLYWNEFAHNNSRIK